MPTIEIGTTTSTLVIINLPSYRTQLPKINAIPVMQNKSSWRQKKGEMLCD